MLLHLIWYCRFSLKIWHMHSIWLFLLFHYFRDLWTTEEKLILGVIQACFYSVSEFVVNCISCISKASLIMASCIMRKNTLSFCCDRKLLLFIACSSASKTPLFCSALEHVILSVCYVLDVTDQKAPGPSVVNLIRYIPAVGYTDIGPNRIETYTYSVAVLPMTGWEELHRGRRFPRKEKPACCLTIWSPLS